LQKLKTNKVLGIDPGLDRTGWAVLKKNGHAGFTLEACGLIHTPANASLPSRLDIIYNEIKKIASDFAPQAAAMEEMFFLKRAMTVSYTIQTRGVILLALHQCGLGVSSYQPKRVKLTICGNGAADKKQMQRMVQLILKLEKELRPDDVADAAAIAICHLKTAPITTKISAHQKFIEKIKEARAKQMKKTELSHKRK
jgi:crossover junction endodeoxyribonuclease RuvC